MKHPREILLGAQAAGAQIPVCDHYSGVETRMLKSLQLQAELTEEFGACLFDVTLDCEDGAPVGGEVDHATLVTAIALDAPTDARVAVRVHPVDHHAFEADMAEAGQSDRVAVLVFSEFGRRLAENASLGTDHGAAAPVFLTGSLARKGLVGAHPSMDPKDLNDGDVMFHTDFRRIYADILAKHLGVDPAVVLGAGFEPLGVLA